MITTFFPQSIKSHENMHIKNVCDMKRDVFNTRTMLAIQGTLKGLKKMSKDIFWGLRGGALKVFLKLSRG